MQKESSGKLTSSPKEVLLSIVTKAHGPLTKIIRFDSDTGELVKDGGQCTMREGKIQKIPISSPNSFAEMLRSLEHHQAIVHGICEYDTAKVVTKSKVGSCSRDAANPVIARTKDFLKYPDGPGVIMFDHDEPRPGSVGSDAALDSYAAEILLNKLATVHPEIAEAAFVATPSTSACIYSAIGELLRGEGSGSHIYLFVKKASDIPRYLSTIGKHLFLAGLGRIELSRSGSALTRTLIDLSVGSPERLDFVAGAVCEDGLEQRLPSPTVQGGAMLDTESLADLTPAQEGEYENILAELKEQAKPSQEEVKTEYIKTEAANLAATKNISMDDARKIVTSRQDHVLEDGDILYFAHLTKGLTVSEVLDDGEAYHNKSLADPLEPEYDGGSKTKAKFYWNGGSPVINSFAHGEFKYKFRRYKSSEKWFEDALAKASVSRFIDHDPPELDWVFTNSLLVRTAGFLVGPGAAGKSTLAILMLMAIATGRDILQGIFTPSRPGKALGVFGEDDETVLHHRVYTMTQTIFEHDHEALNLLRENLLIVTTTGKDVRFISQENKDLEQSEFFSTVSEAVDTVENLRLIILDPVSRFHGAEENDNSAGTFLVSLMEQIAQTTGAAVLFLHHVTKRAGFTQNGFDLEAAMQPDVSRGASGLTNGGRWQCNLFGIPEKDCKKLIGVNDSKPGEYLALKVSKKNFGPPEGVNYLKRYPDGLLRPFDPPTKELDQDLKKVLKSRVLDAVSKNEGQKLTKRKLTDSYQKSWKKEDDRITIKAVGEVITACIVSGELFERPGKNDMGNTTVYLSCYPEPDEENDAA